jgi:rubrerythrin
MAEYIEREALLSAAKGYDWVTGLKTVLKRIPAADVRPVVRGEWDKHEDFDEYGGGRYVEWSCSECCHIVKRGWAVRGKDVDVKPAENFCPNCGARMEES